MENRREEKAKVVELKQLGRHKWEEKLKKAIKGKEEVGGDEAEAEAEAEPLSTHHFHFSFFKIPFSREVPISTPYHFFFSTSINAFHSLPFI